MKNSNRHIVIIASYLNHPGGYERIVPSIANLFTEKNNKVTLLIIGNTAETFYPIHKNVNIILKPYHFGIADTGNMISRKIKMLSDIRGLKKILFQLSPDIVIGTEYHISICAQLTGIQKISKLIAWEHTPIAQSKKNRFWNLLFKKYYPRFNAIVCLNKAENHFSHNWHLHISYTTLQIIAPGILHHCSPKSFFPLHDFRRKKELTCCCKQQKKYCLCILLGNGNS